VSVGLVGSYTLGGINVAANTSVVLMAPALAQLDLALTGSFGLGALQADIAAQFEAAMSNQVALAVQLTNPFEALQQALQAAIAIQASITATIALGLPAVSAEVGVSISASAAISVSLAARLGGIKALIEAALSVKLPAVNFLGDLAGNLSVGPVVLLSFHAPGDTLSLVGAELDALFAAGIGGISPHQQVYGVVLVTGAPSAWAAMQATLRTA
jgi:hypothetical protein